MNLTQQQRQVVESSAKKMVVLSCAGSGKTTVINARISRLLENGISPEAILALTFSNKASQEMKKRLCNTEPRAGFMVDVKTFHAFGLSIIKQYYFSLGFTGAIGIAKRSDVLAILREIFRERNENPIEGPEVTGYLRKCKSFEEYTHDPYLDEIFAAYCQAMKEKNLVDMEDMIWLAVNFLQENDNARNIIHNRYKYIFIDEYQDSNEGQNRLLDLITSEDAELCLVGDDDQAIYEWQGARPQYIREKATSGEYELLKLETNFRSQQGIIEIANGFINKNNLRVPKMIQSGREFTFKPIFKRLEDQASEARYVANRIFDLVANDKYSPSDIAVLFKNNAQADPIREALNARGIKCDTRELDENAQYSQFANVLYSIIYLNSANALSDAINFPERCFDKRVFSEAKAAYCDSYGQDSNFDTMTWIDELYLSSVEFTNSDIFRERYALITQLHQATSWRPTQVITSYIAYMQQRGYDEKTPEKFHLVLQVLDIAKNYEDSNADCTLKNFIDYLTMSIASKDTMANVDIESVNLLTMHRSKGLEFKAVFIIGVQSGIIPNDFFIDTEEKLEAERRLFYVAMTRAKELLFITSFKDPLGASSTNKIVRHGFMAEIPENGISSDEVFSQILRTLPTKNISEPEREKTAAEIASDVIDETIKVISENTDLYEEPVEDIFEMPEPGPVEETSEELVTEPVEEPVAEGAEPERKDISLGELNEEQVDRFMDYSIALSSAVSLPDKMFVVVVGARDVKDKVVQALFKANSISNYELYDYDGKGFQLGKYFNNFRCAGIILGPNAHKMAGVEDAVSLKGKLLSTPGYPYMVDLINRHITKATLVEAITKIKWNYARGNY